MLFYPYFSGRRFNCTLTGNSAKLGGGAKISTLYNCIVYYNNVVYYNNAPDSANYFESTLSYCCTTPLPNGTGNIDKEPRFVNIQTGNLRLTQGSTCIDAWDNSVVKHDLTDPDGKPRIIGARVDMGAYEYGTPSTNPKK